MNKRVAKKKYKKALEVMKTSRKTEIGVTIINQIAVEKTGKLCDVMEKRSSLILLKHPKIQYFNAKVD